MKDITYGRRRICWQMLGRGFDSHRLHKNLSLTVLGVSLVSLAACGNSSSKTETKGSLDNEASKVLTVKHGNVRQNFDKIIMANASQEFSGGLNLDSLKGLVW